MCVCVCVAGDWCNDTKHGFGLMQYPSGNRYTGEWCHDQKHGHGTMEWLTKSQRYTGEWRDNLPNGLGEHVWFQAHDSTKPSRASFLMYNRWVRQISRSAELLVVAAIMTDHPTTLTAWAVHLAAHDNMWVWPEYVCYGCDSVALSSIFLG